MKSGSKKAMGKNIAEERKEVRVRSKLLPSLTQ